MESTTARSARSPKPGEFDPVGQKVHPLDDAPAAMVVASEVLGPERVESFLDPEDAEHVEAPPAPVAPPVTPEEDAEMKALEEAFEPDEMPEVSPGRKRSELAGKRIVFVLDKGAALDAGSWGQAWALLLDFVGDPQLFEAPDSDEAVKLALSTPANSALAEAVKARPGSIYMVGIPASSFHPRAPAPRKVTTEWVTR